MKKVILTIVCLLLALCVTACKSSFHEATVDSASADGGTSDTTAQMVYVISAAGLDLKFPKKWQEKVDVTVEGSKVAFVLNNSPVFDLYFNADEGDPFGTVRGDTYTQITFKTYEVKDAEAEEVQEDLSVISQYLKLDYDFVSGQLLAPIDDSTFDISTDIVTLKYPTRWKGLVQVDVKDDKVSFKRGDEALFDIVFKECNGDLLGTYDGTPVYVVTYKVSDQEAAEMQEDLNTVYTNLLKDDKFTD